MRPDRERDLDRELRELASRVEYPPVPDLARTVRSRLETEAGNTGSPARSGTQLWWVAAAALILLVAVPVFSLAVREMGGGALSAGGGAAGGGAGESGGQSSGERPDAVEQSRATPVPEAQETQAAPGGGSSSAGALAGQAGSAAGSAGGGVSKGSLGLGEKISLSEARARLEGPILLPESRRLGEPDDIYARRDHPRLVFVYRARSGMRIEDTNVVLILTQTPGGVAGAYLPGGNVKGAGLETVNVDGGQGYWIPPSGNSPEVARSAGLLTGVLLWERDGQALRLEVDLPKEEAIRIAESVR